MKATIFKCGYRVIEGRLYFRIQGRSEDGSHIDKLVSGTKSYFYIDKHEADKIPSVQQIIGSEPGPIAMDGRETIRVYTRYPFEVPQARSNFRWSGEADIVYTTRVRVDHGLMHVDLPDTNAIIPITSIRNLETPPNIQPRKLYIDIEVDDSKGFPRATDPIHPITAISFYDSYKKQYGVIHTSDTDVKASALPQHFPREITEPIKVFQRMTEKDLLGALGDLLQKVEPDVIVAWNGYNFDYPYLGERTKRVMATQAPGNPDLQRVVDTFGELGRDTKWRSGDQAAMVDAMVVFQKREMKQRSWALQNVAIDLLGFGKVERPLTVSQLQAKDPEKWAAYCAWDTHLLRLIEEKQSLVNYIFKVARLARIDPEDCEYESRIVDGALMVTARKSGQPRMCLPTKTRGAIEKDARGALTLPPIVGMHEGVTGFDTEQEYPKLMVTFNISPDTRTEEDGPGVRTLPTGGKYRTDRMGLLPEMLLGMIQFRDGIKAQMRASTPGSPEYLDYETEVRATKFFINATAGVIKSSHWRGYNPDVFGDITAMAREQLTLNRDTLQDTAWLQPFIGDGAKGQVISGDTDSCFVKFWKGDAQIVDIDVLNDLSHRIRDALNRSYIAWARKYGAETNYTSVGVEGIFGKLRTLPLTGGKAGAKKRYFGRYDIKDGKDVRHLPVDEKVRLKIAGVEFKRFNNAPVTGTLTLEVMKALMEGAATTVVLAAIERVTKAALAGELDEELLVRCKMGRADFDQYESKQPFARAMENWHHLTNRPVNDGDEFHWAWLSDRETGHNLMAIPLSMTVAEANRLGFRINIDRPKMVEQTITKQVVKVFPEIAGGPSTMSEDEF